MKYHTYSAIDVAFFLLNTASEQGKKITHLQLQKLLYVCHGLSLADHQRPLFIEDVYAWEYGPVIPSVYFKFKKNGASPIENRESITLDSQSQAIIKNVVLQLGDLTGPQLVDLTHKKGSPWFRAWDNTQSLNKVIPDAIIEAHYKEIQKTGRISCL